MAEPTQVSTDTKEEEHLLMLLYKGETGETKLKSLWNTLKSVKPANNTCKIINLGTNLASKFATKDEIKKSSVSSF